MDGINILQTITEKHYTYSIVSLIGGIVLLIFGLLLLSLVVISIKDAFKTKSIDDKYSFIISLGVGSILFLYGILCLTNFFTRTSYSTIKYQVTIDDNVKYNEFINRYNIISHEGKVYIIQNKLDDAINR